MDGANGPASIPTSDGGKGAALARWTRALAATADIDADPQRTLPVIVEGVAARFGDRAALVSDLESLTYAELASRVRRIASWARGSGLKPGEVVALLMENRPDYVAIWLGLTQAGVVVALLNTNLAGAALAHCVETAAPMRAIVSKAMLDAWASAEPHLSRAPELWVHGCDRARAGRFDRAVAAANDEPFGEAGPTLSDRALLIYTSGTTGLPKAAVVTHRRIVSWSLWFAGMVDTSEADRIYDCLPLYHSVGGVVAVGMMLARGGSVAISPSFSASKFWDEVRRFDCTLVQYIGELCRYLLGSPPSATDHDHRVRLFCGNGLRGDIWRAFQDRFAIPNILEFYAASEGTFSLYNMEGEPGAIGRVPAFLAHRFPAAIVRFDPDKQAPSRDEEGRCIRAAHGETGEAIGRISRDPAHRFEGYTDENATQAKIMRNVFADGDAWMRTGDLMRIDEKGFWRFVDRIGDTFRWKGENVSTLEVATVLMEAPDVRDVTVYGVSVPGADGRAGMAAVTPGEGFDLACLAAHTSERLPPYARPVFLRLTKSIETTGTFKHRKQDLMQDGFDPRRTADPIFVLLRGRDDYVPLGADMFDAISDGRVRL